MGHVFCHIKCVTNERTVKYVYGEFLSIICNALNSYYEYDNASVFSSFILGLFTSGGGGEILDSGIECLYW